jgi:hypothetical protein
VKLKELMDNPPPLTGGTSEQIAWIKGRRAQWIRLLRIDLKKAAVLSEEQKKAGVKRAFAVLRDTDVQSWLNRLREGAHKSHGFEKLGVFDG